MKKYIKTKDGRIYQVYDKVFEYKGDKRYQLVDSRFEVSLNDIVKEANTIEELCDEFVGVRKSDNTAHLGKIEDKHWFYEQTDWVGRVENYKVIYGAIWTDKGLIYVAKLNYKGEFELL